MSRGAVPGTRGIISGVPKGPPRRREAPTAVSRKARLSVEVSYPRVRGSLEGEEWAATPVRERERRVEGGLKVLGGDRYSPTGRRRSAEPLLQGAG